MGRTHEALLEAQKAYDENSPSIRRMKKSIPLSPWTALCMVAAAAFLFAWGVQLVAPSGTPGSHRRFQKCFGHSRRDRFAKDLYVSIK